MYYCSNWITFTFHYVSINTRRFLSLLSAFLPLHSTMFLLILRFQRRIQFFSISLHSTMFLLILILSLILSEVIYNFTFHYVSINTILDYFGVPVNPDFTFHYVSINTFRLVGRFDGLHFPLHSTMFLLILREIDDPSICPVLYIPLCFY